MDKTPENNAFHAVVTAVEGSNLQLEMGGYKQCGACNAPRLSGDTCWKCGVVLTKPHHQWRYPTCPDMKDAITTARDLGYALSIHGSLERDIDLIATPWTDNAVDSDMLVAGIARAIKGRVINSENKPLGRRAYTLQADGYYKPIDLSVSPVTTLPCSVDTFKLNWTEERKPDPSCGYNHVIAETPLGRILITWKGWKQFDEPTLDEHPVPVDERMFVVGNLEDTKKYAEKLLFDAMIKMLQPSTPDSL